MKTLLITLTALLCLTRFTLAQTPYSEALARFDTKALQELKPEGYPDQIRRDLVLQTIAIASRQQVRIDPEAAIELDKLYKDASAQVAKEPKESERLKLFPANQIRFIGRLISLAEPSTTENPLAVITQKTLQSLRSELDARVAAFCPCWPFCK